MWRTSAHRISFVDTTRPKRHTNKGSKVIHRFASDEPASPARQPGASRDPLDNEQPTANHTLAHNNIHSSGNRCAQTRSPGQYSEPKHPLISKALISLSWR